MPRVARAQPCQLAALLAFAHSHHRPRHNGHHQPHVHLRKETHDKNIQGVFLTGTLPKSYKYKKVYLG